MIIFTEHAMLKLSQRNIKKELVIQAINNSDRKTKTYGDRISVYKKLGKLYLRVIYKMEDNDTIVITAHWVAKIK